MKDKLNMSYCKGYVFYLFQLNAFLDKHQFDYRFYLYVTYFSSDEIF